MLLPVSSLQPLSSEDLAKNDPAFGLPGNRFGAMLQSYFRSGWAFLIPYLAAYLLHAGRPARTCAGLVANQQR